MSNQQEESQPTKVKNIKSADFVSIYSNNVAYVTNPFDLSLLFGVMREVEESEEFLTVEQKVKVTMSPLQAKILRDILVAQIRGFEETFGEIKMPGQYLRAEPID